MTSKAAFDLTNAILDCVGPHIGSMAFVLQRIIFSVERDAASAPRPHQEEYFC